MHKIITIINIINYNYTVYYYSNMANKIFWIFSFFFKKKKEKYYNSLKYYK